MRKPSIGFFGPTDKVASGRYRNIMPFTWLMNNGWEPGHDVLVCMKHEWPYDPTTGYKKYIYDVCDDHFTTGYREHYLKHCEQADLVTCNSKVMRDIIEQHTGRVARVIPDPVEFETQDPHYSKSFLCFGNKWNINLLKKVPNLHKALGDYYLQVISEPFADFVTPYSEESIKAGFDRAGAVIIPVGKRIAKSANRLIESINAGCFVICNPMPAYDEFKRFAYVGDIAKGIEWYLNNPEEALSMVSEGQKYIQERYTMNQIGPMWGDALGAC